MFHSLGCRKLIVFFNINLKLEAISLPTASQSIQLRLKIQITLKFYVTESNADLVEAGSTFFLPRAFVISTTLNGS